MSDDAQDPIEAMIQAQLNADTSETTEEASQASSDEQSSGALVLSRDSLPERLYLLPVHNRPFFPAQVQPLLVSRKRWEQTLEKVAETAHHALGVVFVEQETEEEATQEHMPCVGCAVKIHRAQSEGSRIQFVAQGLRRFRIERWLSKTPPYLVEVTYPREPLEDNEESRAWALSIINGIKELLPINPLYGEELKHYLHRFSPNEPGPLSDFAAAITSAKGHELQQVLETLPVLERMQVVLPLLRTELEVAKLQSEISEEVNQKIQERQRSFFLKEQLKVLQRELGISKDDKSADVDEFRERLQGKKVPKHAQKRIEEELHKLSLLETGSPEYGVTRNYLDWMTSIPWGVRSQDNLSLSHARTVLDQDHDGLKDVKERIIEFLAEGNFKGDVGGSILLLVGPPGVGKTSIGRSIAQALGRKFYRFSVGGMRDEAEIKGHRRTYIGAMPGKLAQALKEVEVENPVIMLDEIDKLGASYQGDPASALLEVLDPEQNIDFLDHYLDVRLDLSKVLFVCTANQLDTIPSPLLDRMENIRLSGYIAEEKFAIAKHHLWPRLLKRAGLKKKQIDISDAALKAMIEGYAREAGVRQLEKLLHRIMRKAAVKLLQDEDCEKIKITQRHLKAYLGTPVFRKEQKMQGIGVVTGLAWTSLGGATLAIEASRIHQQQSGLKLTGKLGEVMRESAEIAYSYIRSHLGTYGAPPKFYDKAFIHLHVPEGATPKDGPSAGITMASALLSLARRQKLRPLAMTGELSLSGQVLPVGGIREKIIAARRAKITELILPEANRGDYEELPDYLRLGMQVHFAQHFRDVAKVLFTETTKEPQTLPEN